MSQRQRPQTPGLIARCSRLLVWVYWPILAGLTHWPNVQTPGVPKNSDKIFHLICFGLLTGLMALAWAQGRDRQSSSSQQHGDGRVKDWRFVAVLLFAAAYSLVDEFTQQWIPGRVSGWPDALANLSGVALMGCWLKRKAIGAWSAANTHWIARAMLLILLPMLAWIAFKPDFRWGDYVNPGNMYRLGWVHQRHRPPPYDAIVHVVVPMLLIWLLPTARLFGRKHLTIKNTLIVGAVIASAYVVENFQHQLGRSLYGSEQDIAYHHWGVAAGLVGWAMAASMRTGRNNEPTDEQKDRHFVGHAMVVSVLTLLSRVTGLVREAVMSASFGVSPVLSAFAIGFMVPNLFRRLFGEGALSAAFIPAYAEQLKKDRDLAKRMASLCLALLLIVTAALTLIGEFTLAYWRDRAVMSAETTLAVNLTMRMLPYMPLICATALMGGVLQVHRRFGPFAAAPIILNLVMILAAVFAASGFNDPFDAERGVRIVANSVLVAGVLQLIWQATAMFHVESLSWRCRRAAAALKPVWWMMLPMALGLAVFQINTMLDTVIAFGLAQPENGGQTLHLFGYTLAYPIADRGAPAALTLAQRLYQFPLGVFGVALATAIFPALANSAAQRANPDQPDDGRYQAILHHGLRLTMFIGLPASAGLILTRLPLTRTIFESGRVQLADSLRIAWLLAAYGSGVWAYALTHTITRAYHAVKDARTPLWISMIMVALNLALNLTLIWSLGEVGLAWSTTISASVQTVLLIVLLKRYVKQPMDRSVLVSWSKSALLTMSMTAALWLSLQWFDPAAMSRQGAAILLAGMTLGGGGIYLLGARLLGCEELRWLMNRRTQ